MTDPIERHDPMTRWLHWLTAGAVLGAWLLGTVSDGLPRGAGREALREAHFACGLLALLFGVARLLWRPLARQPWRAAPLAWARWAERAVKLGLYLLPLIAVGLGIATQWAKGRAVEVFGLVLLPTPWLADRNWSHWVGELHESSADALLLLVGLHALAGLVHGFVLRDGVLRGMVPARAPRGARGDRVD